MFFLTSFDNLQFYSQKPPLFSLHFLVQIN
nr:MAG TPA: hypothetical protein [Caudoviricetes sp.]